VNWSFDSLGRVCPAAPIKRVDTRPEEDVWLLNLDQVESQSGNILSKMRAPYSEAGNSTHWFDERHVLYSKLRPYLNKVVLPDEQGLATTELVPLLPDPKRLNRKYLVYYLRSNQFVNWVNTQVAGAKMPRVSMKVFWEHEIPLPPLPEQKRITAILDKADAIRRKRQQSIQLADDFLRAVFLDMFGDPVTNPKGWEDGTIRDLVTEAKYGSSQKAHVTDGQFPILRMGNITYEGGWNFTDLKHVDLSEKDQPKYLLKKRDLVFNRTNSKELVGKTAVFESDDEMAIAGYLIRVRTNDIGNPYYISAYLNSDHGKRTLQGMCKSIVGMANINAQELQNIQILLPPKTLQDDYEKLVVAVRKRVFKMNMFSNDSAELFSSLSQKAFAGKL